MGQMLDLNMEKIFIIQKSGKRSEEKVVHSHDIYGQVGKLNIFTL